MKLSRIGLIAVAILVTGCENDSDTHQIVASTSPDGCWVATGYEIRNYGPGAASAFLRVAISPAVDASKAEDVLLMEEPDSGPGDLKRMVKLRWTDASHLLITAPGGSPQMLASEKHGIAISRASNP